MAILEAKKTILYKRSGADRVPLYPKTSADHVIATDKSGADSTVQAELEALRSDISTLQELSFSYKGKAASESDITDYSAGDYWIVGTAGTYGGNTCEVGDVLVCTQSTNSVADDFVVLQANLVSAVQSDTAAPTAGHVATYSGTNAIQDSGFTIESSVPADAKFTDTTYSEATTSASGLMSAAQVTKLAAIEEGAEVNQNAFSVVQAGDTALTADAKSDTVTLAAGTGITITGSGKTATIAVNSSEVAMEEEVVTVTSLEDVPSTLKDGGLIIVTSE